MCTHTVSLCSEGNATFKGALPFGFIFDTHPADIVQHQSSFGDVFLTWVHDVYSLDFNFLYLLFGAGQAAF